MHEAKTEKSSKKEKKEKKGKKEEPQEVQEQKAIMKAAKKAGLSLLESYNI